MGKPSFKSMKNAQLKVWIDYIIDPKDGSYKVYYNTRFRHIRDHIAAAWALWEKDGSISVAQAMRLTDRSRLARGY